MQTGFKSSDAARDEAEAPIPGLIWAFRIHEDGRSEPLDVDRSISLRGEGLLWLHFNLADVRARHWLGAIDLGLPAIAKALFLSNDNF